MEEARLKDLAQLVHIESSNPENSALRHLADCEIEAIKSMLTMAGPPCARCHFFRFELNKLVAQGRNIYDGYQFCHTPKDMERDFSCFRERGSL